MAEEGVYWRNLDGGYGNAGMRPERRPGAGIPGGRVTPIQLALLAQESWRESDKSREREGRALAVRELCFLRSRGGFGAPATGATLEHVAVMQKTIQHRAHGGNISEQLAPVLDGPVGSQQRTASLVAAHDDLQQILGGGVGKFAHTEVVDDEQGHCGDNSM